MLRLISLSKPRMRAMPFPHLISRYPCLSARVKIMEAVCLIQINPEVQGTMSATVYLDLLETVVRLTSTSACLIRATEVIVLLVAFHDAFAEMWRTLLCICDYCPKIISQYLKKTKKDLCIIKWLAP